MVDSSGSNTLRSNSLSNHAVRPMRFLCSLLLIALLAPCDIAAQDRVFTVPLEDLKTWSQKAVAALNIEITGSSKVHRLQNDCELHFGAKATGYAGDPPGVVLEPMNVCLEPFPGKSVQSNKDWETFASNLKGARVRVEGVPRIWPEHLDGEESPSNPNHALEIHPLTRLQRGNTVYDFSNFVYAPEDYEGGVSAQTAVRILTRTEVSVVERNGMVEVQFESGPIGNFTILNVAFSKTSIQQLPGGHRIKGEVILDRDQRIPVALLTVNGSRIDAAVERLKTRKRSRFVFEVLVLFSLDPDALYRAARQSSGKPVAVPDPLQLIVYGVPDTRE